MGLRGMPLPSAIETCQQMVEAYDPAVKSIDDSGRLNTGLWDLAEQFSLN